MNNQDQSPKFLRQRKFYTVLPLLVIPFLTLFFWALGGGKTEAANSNAGAKNGLNTTLPDAYLKEGKPLDKMSYYDKAATDSLKRKELMKNDPNYRDTGTLNSSMSSIVPVSDSPLSASALSSSNTGSVYRDANEEKVYNRLAQLNSALNAPPTAKVSPSVQGDYPVRANGMKSEDIDRLEKMMQSMNQKTDDPEMAQLDGMLNKIMDIQNPGRVQEKLRQNSEKKKGQVFAVQSGKKPDPVSSLDNNVGVQGTTDGIQPTSKGNGFFSFDQSNTLTDSQNAVQAVVHETQTLTGGATVKLRLVNDIYINGVLIPHDQFIYGTAALSGERLTVKVTSVRYRNSLFPVELSVYDMDGLDGIYVPGAISREVAKTSTEQGMQNIGLTTLDPSLGMQAAGVGIEAAKSFLGKKVKLIRVTVKAGYQVLLRDEKQKQQQ